MTGDFVRTDIINPGELSESEREALKHPGTCISLKSKLLYRVREDLVLCVDDGDAGRRLIECIRCSVYPSSKKISTAEDAYRALLFSADKEELKLIVSRFGIPENTKRNVVVFHSDVLSERTLFSSFSEIAPTEKKDIVLETDPKTVVLIKHAQKLTEDDIAEYASAVIDTMNMEGIGGIHAGIGSATDKTDEISGSFHEALESIRLGNRFNPSAAVFRYSGMMLEKIMDSFSDKEILFLRREAGRLRLKDMMNDEMTDTVQAFFRNDLNAAATAKELFIHRNTLIYRLDKVKRETGLDLQVFHDAMAFKLLLEFSET